MDNCGKCYYCRQKGLMMKCRHLKKVSPNIVILRREPAS
jgi:hypothetical protein